MSSLSREHQAQGGSVNSDPQFIDDLNSLESTTITVAQPSEVTISRDGPRMWLSLSGRQWISSDLTPKARASACHLIRELVAKHPFERSFRSIQKDYFIEPECMFFFSRGIGDKKECVFQVDVYQSSSPVTMEIKHMLGGAAISLDKNMESELYLFFAECACQYPKMAKPFRDYAEYLAREEKQKADNSGRP